jgi:sec-independent protein translocase protein TatA
MGISPTQLIIILIIVALLFGTKKLRNIGSDLGGAFKGFKKAMSDEEKEAQDEDRSKLPGKPGEIIEGSAKKVEPEQKDKV